MKEVVLVVARRRALRIIGVVLGGQIPSALLWLIEDLWVEHAVTGVTVLSYVAGAGSSRWLFLAEAEHVIGL